MVEGKAPAEQDGITAVMSEKPNIVFIMPDQLRHDFLSCYGASFIHTPYIDSIGERGIRYTNAYSGSPGCVPARMSLLTGMNAIRNGVLDNLHALAPTTTRPVFAPGPRF